MGTTAASSRQAAVSRCRPAAQGQADGLIRLSGRIPAGGDTQSIIMSPGQRPRPGGQLPWVAIEEEYRFDADNGTRTLAEFFDGRSQLLLYHFMLARQDKGKFYVRLVRD